MSKTVFRFPENFLFGTATSAPQIEGAAYEDGRGASIWDKFAQRPGAIKDGTTPAVTCDFYHRYKEDIALASELGIRSFRFSFSWSRILPEGRGQVNQRGLDFYRRMLDELDRYGIVPNATLYHWDLPQALEDQGGWLNRDTVKWYGEYASLLFREFGDRIPMWATVNEPIATYVGYGEGIFAPGHSSEPMGRQADHHILLAHGEGVRRFREENIKDSQIGIVVDIWHHHPLRPDYPEDVKLAELNNEKTYRSFLNPIFKGAYTEPFLRWMEENHCMPQMQPEDMARISSPIDFFGLNCYNRVVDCADEKLLEAWKSESRSESCDRVDNADGAIGGNFQDDGREFYPRAVYDAVHILKEEYDVHLPIYITENGTPGTDEQISGDGCVHDRARIEYIEGFLRWIAKAMEEGADIRGYYVWSLMDNWEWNAGFTSRYGLTYVDFDTQKRTVKDSGRWYQDLIRRRTLELSDDMETVDDAEVEDGKGSR